MLVYLQYSSATQKYHWADAPERSSPNGLARTKRQPERGQPDLVCQGPYPKQRSGKTRRTCLKLVWFWWGAVRGRVFVKQSPADRVSPAGRRLPLRCDHRVQQAQDLQAAARAARAVRVGRARCKHCRDHITQHTRRLLGSTEKRKTYKLKGRMLCCFPLAQA